MRLYKYLEPHKYRFDAIMTSQEPPSWTKYKRLFPELMPHYKRAHHVACHLIETPWDTMPNILLSAPKGFPMSLFLNHIIVQKFGPATRTLHHFPNHPDIPFVETQYVFEIDLLHPNIKSLDVVSDFIHSVISQANVCMEQRHIFLLQNIDALEDERYAFRVLFERFSKNVLFVCTTTRISCIESPLRSRFCIWTLPALSVDEIQMTMKAIGKPVHPYLKSSQNLLKVLLIADMEPSMITQEVCTYAYPPMVDFFQKVLGKPRGSTSLSVEDLRTLSLKICSYNLTLSEVIQDICTLLASTRGGTTDAVYIFLEQATEIEHAYASTRGGRKPLYCEWILHTALKAAGVA